MPFCTNCGAPTGGDGKKFCTKCGAALLEMPAGPEPPTALTSGPLPEPPTVITPQPASAPPTASAPGPPTFVSPPGSWPPPQPPPAPGYEFPPAGPSQPAGFSQPAGPSPVEPSYQPPAPTYQPPEPFYQPPAPPDQPPPGRTAMWIAGAVAAVLVLGGGGFAVWKFLGHHAATAAPPAPTAGATSPGTSGSTAARTPTQAPTAPRTAQPTSSPTQSGFGAGFPVAATAAAAAQPGEQQVVSFLQSYFTAINNHDYGRYASLVTSSQRPTPQQFQSGFGSTTDSNATLTGLAITANGMAATLKFTSHQLPSASPTGTSCDAWHITLFLQYRAGGYRVGPTPPGYHAHDRAC